MRGFTLIELLIATTVIGVLAAIALPGYQSVRHRAQRTDARLALLWIQHQQERHYAAHNTYATQADLSDRSADGDYDIAVTLTAGGQGFLATARANPSGRQARDLPCRWYSINEAGQRRSATAAGAWSDDDPNRCWS